MPEKVSYVKVTMPEFEYLLPEKQWKEATFSLGILEEGIPCGVVCANFTNFQFYLSWFYIEPSKRRLGYGSLLLTELLSLIREAGEAYPMQLSFTSMDRSLAGFFQSYEHFYVSEIGEIYGISPSHRKKSGLYQKLVGMKSVDCPSYFDFTTDKKEAFLAELHRKHSGLAQLVNLDMNLYEYELSFAYGKGKIRAAVFVKKLGQKGLDISCIYATDIGALFIVLRALSYAIETLYPEHAVRIICINNQSRMMVRKLFKDVKEEFLLQADWDLRLPGEYPAFNE